MKQLGNIRVLIPVFWQYVKGWNGSKDAYALQPKKHHIGRNKRNGIIVNVQMECLTPPSVMWYDCENVGYADVQACLRSTNSKIGVYEENGELILPCIFTETDADGCRLLTIEKNYEMNKGASYMLFASGGHGFMKVEPCIEIMCLYYDQGKGWPECRPFDNEEALIQWIRDNLGAIVPIKEGGE